MRSDPYRKHPITKQFNKRYIIQLLNNYRSHREILRFPNETFYDGTIISKGLQSNEIQYYTYNNYMFVTILSTKFILRR